MKKTIAFLLCMLLTVSVLTLTSCTSGPLNYVVIGDSIARGAGIYNSEEGCYGRLVADTNGYEYANFGIDGLTSWQLLEKIRTEPFTEALKKADVISISIGGNDYMQQNIPKLLALIAVGNYKLMDELREDFRGYYADIIAYIKDLNPRAVILAQTLYNPRLDLLKGAVGEATKRVNEVITDYVDAHPGEIELIDTVPVMNGRAECIAIDGIHPSAVGNEELAKLVLQKLFELGLGENTELAAPSEGIDQLPFSSKVIKNLKEFFQNLLRLSPAL